MKNVNDSSVFPAVALLTFSQAVLLVLGQPFVDMGDAALVVGGLYGLWLHFFEPVQLIVNTIPWAPVEVASQDDDLDALDEAA